MALLPIANNVDVLLAPQLGGCESGVPAQHGHELVEAVQDHGKAVLCGLHAQGDGRMTFIDPGGPGTAGYGCRAPTCRWPGSRSGSAPRTTGRRSCAGSARWLGQIVLPVDSQPLNNGMLSIASSGADTDPT